MLVLANVRECCFANNTWLHQVKHVCPLMEKSLLIHRLFQLSHLTLQTHDSRRPCCVWCPPASPQSTWRGRSQSLTGPVCEQGAKQKHDVSTATVIEETSQWILCDGHHNVLVFTLVIGWCKPFLMINHSCVPVWYKSHVINNQKHDLLYIFTNIDLLLTTMASMTWSCKSKWAGFSFWNACVLQIWTKILKDKVIITTYFL